MRAGWKWAKWGNGNICNSVHNKNKEKICHTWQKKVNLTGLNKDFLCI